MEKEKFLAPESPLPESVVQELPQQEEVINILDKILDTHTKESTFEEDDVERKHLASVDKAVISVATEYEKTLGQILERYGHDIYVEKIGNGLFRIPLSHTYLRKLPDGYGYIGGAARATLSRLLGIDMSAKPRDIDIVRVLNKDVFGLDSEMSEKYSSEDYAYGHGVQNLKENYFETCDFTLNEALVYGDWVYLTKDCLLDTVRRVLRFTEYEKRNTNEYGDVEIHQKLLAKAIRLASEEVVRGRNLEIKDKEVFQLGGISPFYIALHLDRAFSRGTNVAIEYVRQLVSLEQLPDSITDPIKAVDYLLEAMEKPYVFQYAPEFIVDADNEIDRMYEKFGHLIDKWEE